MVFARKFLTPQQMKETGTTKTGKAKSRMVICGNFASESQAWCESTSTHNVHLGLLGMMLSMTDGRNETLTTVDIANAFLNASINKDTV
eukprot:12921158-Prorocentrum_lima.AAC.1